MVIPWGTIQSLLLFFGPLLLPRAIALYRSVQAAAARQQQQQQQQAGGPRDVEGTHRLRWRAAAVLAVLAAAAVKGFWRAGVLGGSVVSPLAENIFVATASRLQTPTDVLFTRLAARRPGRLLTAADEALRARLVSLDSRLLYLQFGPDVLVGCPFCADGGDGSNGSSSSSSSTTAYLCYALVDLAAQHLTTLVLIALATSPLVVLGRRGGGGRASGSGAPGSDRTDLAYDLAAARTRRWRTPATVATLLLAAADMALLATYNHQANARATRLADLDCFFWTMQRVRGLVSGLLLGGLGLLLYCAVSGWAPNRPAGPLLRLFLFGPLPAESPAERITTTARALATTRSRLNAAAIVKNTALRDVELRARTQAYWAREVALVAEAMEERDVIEGINDALENRLDMRQIEHDADVYVQNVVPLRGGSERSEGGDAGA
ncbi:hypothetical protein CMQ_4467 [Grosmannia clavigera kw1407]|uniref:Uncharacterized protein n=1 Tax=Grosmannia clavigera (strain kw1407 / UAMH 11150) TaxID=655863 RepID=F0XTN6_GROCL|nr:uncharacterized protein CMQ_4467 [Grosmannia clavigera kw1407]EFW98615.1 hypothetical protein CMQ_4467 [Grosmannia clavigera kw1407]